MAGEADGARCGRTESAEPLAGAGKARRSERVCPASISQETLVYGGLFARNESH
jgi:hypothetical protein